MDMCMILNIYNPTWVILVHTVLHYPEHKRECELAGGHRWRGAY